MPNPEQSAVTRPLPSVSEIDQMQHVGFRTIIAGISRGGEPLLLYFGQTAEDKRAVTVTMDRPESRRAYLQFLIRSASVTSAEAHFAVIGSPEHWRGFDSVPVVPHVGQETVDLLSDLVAPQKKAIREGATHILMIDGLEQIGVREAVVLHAILSQRDEHVYVIASSANTSLPGDVEIAGLIDAKVRLVRTSDRELFWVPKPS